jgi:hypothetical protein
MDTFEDRRLAGAVRAKEEVSLRMKLDIHDIQAAYRLYSEPLERHR